MLKANANFQILQYIQQKRNEGMKGRRDAEEVRKRRIAEMRVRSKGWRNIIHVEYGDNSDKFT